MGGGGFAGMSAGEIVDFFGGVKLLVILILDYLVRWGLFGFLEGFLSDVFLGLLLLDCGVSEI